MRRLIFVTFTVLLLPASLLPQESAPAAPVPDWLQRLAELPFLGLFTEWSAVIAAGAGALWALLTFRRNNRIKAAEILINLEREYASHIPTLLQLENKADYDAIFREPLRKSVSGGGIRYTRKEGKAIDALEAALRYFFVCANVRRLSVDAGAIDKLCAWYLRVLVTDKDENGYRRPELREYIRHYWPTIYLWAPLAPEPGPRRAAMLLGQIPERIRYWRTGSWAKPPVQAIAPPTQPANGPSPVRAGV